MTQEQSNRDYLLLRAYQAGITDPQELANFMGQMEIESGGFRSMHENLGYSGARLLQVFRGRNGIDTSEDANAIASGGPEAVANAIYGGEWGRNSGLRNNAPGDGWRFHGRGYIQLTGRDNYERGGRELGLDLAGNPDLAADPSIAADIALHYWRTRVVAQGHQLDVERATRDINGGEHGMAERIAAASRWQRALTSEVMGRLAQGEVALPSASTHRVTSDPTVKRLQQNLNDLGITDAEGRPLAVDGNRGGPRSNTSEAIAAFQQRFGLDGQMSNADLLTATQAALDADPVRSFERKMGGVLPEDIRPARTTDGMPDYLLPGRTPLRSHTSPAAAGSSASFSTLAIMQVQPGDHGTAVRVLQEHLNLLGATDRFGNRLGEDSDYGDRTKEAVEQFQLWTGRETTGIADKDTLAALRAQAQFADRQRAQGVAPGPHLADNLRPDLSDAGLAADPRPMQGRGQGSAPADLVLPASALRSFSDPNHPQHALYADVKARLQADGHALSEERLSQVTAELHERGFSPGWRGGIVVKDEMIYARDADQPERRAGFETTQPAPPVQETMQQAAAYQQQIQQQAQQHLEQMGRGSQGPSL